MSNMNDLTPSQAATTTSEPESESTPPTVPSSAEQVTGTSDEEWLETKCIFCKQDLKENTEPKLLPCLHSSCKACLTAESVPSPAAPENLDLLNNQNSDIIEVGVFNSRTTPSVKIVNCPTCSQEINPNDVIDHLFLLEHLSPSGEGQSTEETKTFHCTSCEDSAPAWGFCPECQEWLCEACIQAHQRVRVTKDHTIRPKEEMEGEKTTGLGQKYLFCPVHRQEQLKLYCESCDKLTCRDCQLQEHKDHRYQFISKACEEEKLYLNTLLGKIKEKRFHIDNARVLVNKRHNDITQREQAVTQEIKQFAVRYITEINRRGKLLLQELDDVCTRKKNDLSIKNQELVNLGIKLQHCLKFAESSIAHGSDVALVYSKRAITNQLRQILRRRCDVPNPQHIVDIQFMFETNFLTQYIATMGSLIVDQQPLANTNVSVNTMRNNTLSGGTMHASVNHGPPNQIAPQSNRVPQNQMQMPQAGTMVTTAPRGTAVHGNLYGQPQVSSSTHPSGNVSANSGQQLRHLLNTGPQTHTTYTRTQTQANVHSGLNQQQTGSFTVPTSVQYNQRTVQSPVRQQQQQQQQPPAPPPLYQPVSLPLPRNSSITISPVTTPSAPKQRAVAPRPNIQVTPVGSQQNAMALPQLQRMPSNQINTPHQQQRPQVIVIDENAGASKMPTMSNTSRLSHYPSAQNVTTSHLPTNFQSNSGQTASSIPPHMRNRSRENSPHRTSLDSNSSQSFNQSFAEIADRNAVSITSVQVKQEKNVDQPTCSISRASSKDFESAVDVASKSLGMLK